MNHRDFETSKDKSHNSNINNEEASASINFRANAGDAKDTIPNNMNSVKLDSPIMEV